MKSELAETVTSYLIINLPYSLVVQLGLMLVYLRSSNISVRGVVLLPIYLLSMISNIVHS